MSKPEKPGIRNLARHLPLLAGGAAALLAFILALGLLHLNLRLGGILTNSSYNWSFDLSLFERPGIQDSEVVIIYLDEASHKQLDQPFNRPWDRALHARLVERLTEDDAKAILFDIIFSDPGPDPDADERLAAAIRKNGRVILAADYVASGQVANDNASAVLTTLTLPHTRFREAAAGWGIAQLKPDSDFIAREHFHGPPGEETSSLSWATARLINLPVAANPDNRTRTRWINYYGTPETVPHVSYAQALFADGVPPGYFKDKIVLIGARPITTLFIERRDELRSPYSTWNQQFLFMPAVEVHATQMLNLCRGDWLRRTSPACEWLLFGLVALVFGFGLNLFRPLTAAAIAASGMLAVSIGATLVFHLWNLWFPWVIAVAVQIPLLLLWSVLFRSLEWYVQRRKMERARQEADRQIRQQAALLDKAQDAIIVQDLDGRVTYWNRSAERLYGWTAEEVRVQPPPSVAGTGEVRLKVMEKGEWAGGLEQTTRSGSKITVQSRWTLVRDDNGNPTSILIINTDVTEQKKLEAQFLRTQRMESIGTLAGGIAHDLNNVLSPVLIGVEILRMRLRDDQHKNILNTIETSARRGTDMVKQVLTFARGVEGEKNALQIAHLIKEMDKIVKETFPRSIQIQHRVPNDLRPVLGDATQLHQVILNLCVNARDAMPDGGRILIEAKNLSLDATAAKLLGLPPGDYVQLSAGDTGTGIPPEILEKIFEPFFTTKEIGKGTGLGLSTVMSIIKSHNGALDVSSEVGKGTTFHVYLPALLESARDEVVRPDPSTLRGRNELILVVDDEAAVRETTQAILEDCGYQVLTAVHGAEALSIFATRQEEITAIIIDMMMPIMDGPTTLRELRKLAPELPCVAVSGLLQVEKHKEEFRNENILFLAKPFSAEKLLTTLRNLLSPTTPPPTQGDSDRNPATRLPESARP